VALRALGIVALGGLYTFAVFYAYSAGWWVDLFAPAAGLAFALLVGGLLGFFTVGRRARQFKEAWGKYLSPEVVEELSKDIENIRPEVGERREMTVLFSDVIGFTPLSEKLSAEEVIRTLNEYFSDVVPVIFRNGGTLDKYVGDCIMALWGAPKKNDTHALSACRAALGMAAALDRLRERWRAQDRPELDVGIGINSGAMVVGNIGSPERLDYTVIGDNVNVAARLESLTREKKVRIIISEATWLQVKDRVEARDLGEAKVKGRAVPVRVYELIALKDQPAEAPS
jgi:adenylate cyclase